MYEYMIRFVDGTIKHIKADDCKFSASVDVPMAVFFKNGRIYYSINLTSVSAIKFPEVDKNDEPDTSDGNT